MKSSSRVVKTSADNLEDRFDAKEDVLDYFDPDRAILSHGGARRGAGRKATGKLRKTVKLSPAAIKRLEKFARRRGLPDFSSAVEEASIVAARTA